MARRNILSLTGKEKEEFLNSFDHVFSDIDGVVWNLSHTIEGAAEGFDELRQMGKIITFITNNSVRSEMQCLKKLRSNNINVEPDNFMHPAKTIVEYLKRIQFDGLIYILASTEFKNVLRLAGYELLEGPENIIDEVFAETLKRVLDQHPVKAVIIDFDLSLSYLKLMAAYYYLRKPDCLLIGGATDFHLPVSKDLTILGPGPFLKVLEETSRKEMLTFGKPSKGLAQALMQRSNVPAPGRTLMIGDMLDQDIRFASSCGFQSLLVLSGGCSYEELFAQTDRDAMPDYYAHSMADFVEFMRDVSKSSI